RKNTCIFSIFGVAQGLPSEMVIEGWRCAVISVPFYSNESFMANSALKQRTALGIKLGLGAISLLLTIILGLIGVIWDTTKDKVKSIETTISVINISQTKQGELLAKQVELLARLDERFKSVDDRTKSLEERTKTLE